VIAVYTHLLDLAAIMQYQQESGPLLFIAFPAACAMFLVILSKMPFGPFSIVEAKELVSGYKTEHFGIWRAGLEVCNGLKTYVLLAVFLSVFIGPMSLPWLLAGMILLIVLLAFSCAITPMMSPFDSVTIQMLVTGLMLVYAAAVLVVHP
jgi:energy-converting hydrogenase A subunit J